MSDKKGIIAVHGYHREYSKHEQEEIINAFKPVIDIVNAELMEYNKNHIVVAEKNGTYRERLKTAAEQFCDENGQELKKAVESLNSP